MATIINTPENMILLINRIFIFKIDVYLRWLVLNGILYILIYK